MTAATNHSASIRYGGLEQFRTRGSVSGVDYCIAGSEPYSLEFANPSDVICLLLGDIVSRAKFEDDREAALVFRGDTAAFHPRQGNVRVEASVVKHGFVAFSYSDAYQATISDRSLRGARRSGSTNNINRRAIRHLACYAREKLRQHGTLGELEIQYLGGLLYLETIDGLLEVRPVRRVGLSDEVFRRLIDFIDAEMEFDISCERLAKAADLPLRIIFDGIKDRTGLSAYQFVLSRRIQRAQELLAHSHLPISEIAFTCGFASQQHLTATLSRKLGQTPSRLRQGS